MFTRPGEAGALSQTPLSLIKTLSQSSLVKISSSKLHSQKVRAREMTFLKKVHLPPPVMCQMACVICHVSCVSCHVSCVTCNLFSSSFMD